MKKRTLSQAIMATTMVVTAIARPVEAALVLGSTQGYEASLSGSIPVFLVLSEHDATPTTQAEQAARIQSGFNPASLNLHIKAPAVDGLTVSAHLQYNSHLQGAGQQNSGLLESRIAEIHIDGAFGTVKVGKGFGIFNSSAIGDIGSAIGVGWLGGGADTANATGGHIGTGYVYANFNPHIIYHSPEINNAKFKIGLINPEDPEGYNSKNVETKMPRVEGQLDYVLDASYGELKLWTGFLYQNIRLIDKNYDYNMTGVDVGAHIDVDIFGLTLAYTQTTGIGADGLYGFNTDGGVGINDAEVEATQWYSEVDYVLGKTTLGASYGEGQQDATVTPVGVARAITNQLAMLFVHHKITPALTVVAEIQQYRSQAQADYQAYIMGIQFDF